MRAPPIASSPETLIYERKKYVELMESSLFYKPNTNLCYLNNSTGNHISNVFFNPQMTFTSNCEDTLEIIQRLTKNTYGKDSVVKQNVSHILNLSKKFIQQWNKNSIKTPELISSIPLHSKDEKQLQCCLFFILFKMYVFIQHKFSAEDTMKQKYIKNYIPYLARHSTMELYEHSKSILAKYIVITDDEYKIYELTHNFFCNPDLLKLLYDPGQINVSAPQFIVQLNEDDDNFGNPLYSATSFFDYMDLLHNEEDWFNTNNFDISAFFDLKVSSTGDLIFFVECRNFNLLIYKYYNSKYDDHRKVPLSFMKNIVMKGRRNTKKRKTTTTTTVLEPSRVNIGGRRKNNTRKKINKCRY